MPATDYPCTTCGAPAGVPCYAECAKPDREPPPGAASTKPLWARFDADGMATDPQARAQWHAERAEWILAEVDVRATAGVGVAAVHAQLAVAWTAIAARQPVSVNLGIRGGVGGGGVGGGALT